MSAPAQFSIPAAVLASHIGILGKTGSGKSNGAKTIAERLMAGGQRVCAIDPTGTWWGLRLMKDGKEPSAFKPVIFGGAHADIPFGAAHGAAIAEAIGTSSDSAIIDTRQMTTGDRTRFFTDFAEAILRTNVGELHLILDEAHLFAPKGRVNDPKSGMMLSATNNLVSLGRGNGLKIILISQRPAKLHNDCLSQIETMIAMRFIAPHDRRAIEDWIKETADPAVGRDIVTSLSSLGQGDAWIWAPEIGILERMHFKLASTFDSGRARTGDKALALKPINAEKMAERLEAIRKDVFANDPVKLKARIKELETAAAASVSVPAGQSEEEKQRMYKAGFEAGREAGEIDAYKSGMTAGIAVGITRARNAINDLRVDDIAKNEPPPAARAAPPAPAPVARPVVAPTSPPPAYAPRPPASDAISLGGERKPLALLVAAAPAGYTEAQWASLAGFKRSGGTWGTYKSRLRSKGLVEERGGLWYATPDGIAAIGDDMPAMPTHPDERIAMWKEKISGVSPMLDALRAQYPQALTKSELAFMLGMAPTGGTFGTYLSRLRSNGLVDEPEKGSYRLASIIMES